MGQTCLTSFIFYTSISEGGEKKLKPEINRTPEVGQHSVSSNGSSRPTSWVKGDQWLLRHTGLRCCELRLRDRAPLHAMHTHTVLGREAGGASVRQSQVQGSRFFADQVCNWASFQAGAVGFARANGFLEDCRSRRREEKTHSLPRLSNKTLNSREPNSHSSRLQLRIYLAPKCTLKCAYFLLTLKK